MPLRSLVFEIFKDFNLLFAFFVGDNFNAALPFGVITARHLGREIVSDP